MLFSTRIELFYSEEQDCLLAHEPDGTVHEFNSQMLREAKELFTRYDDLDEMHNFCERMAKASPEVIDVESPYLN